MTTWDSTMAGQKDRGELPETRAQSYSSRSHTGCYLLFATYYSQFFDAVFSSLPWRIGVAGLKPSALELHQLLFLSGSS